MVENGQRSKLIPAVLQYKLGIFFGSGRRIRLNMSDFDANVDLLELLVHNCFDRLVPAPSLYLVLAK